MLGAILIGKWSTAKLTTWPQEWSEHPRTARHETIATRPF